MLIELPNAVQTAINLLEKSGFEAYIVGGCVRDIFTNKPPHDWDITTLAKPVEMQKVFKDYKLIETGIAHGTLTVLIDGMSLEITTYRIDGEYKDNRHPSNVVFTSQLCEDLSRRDFTMNALAYNETVGIVDEFGGAEDIADQVVRCVGDPDTRFNEDALRIIRALRFASVLGFEIEAQTKKAILDNKELLAHVSAERITEELLKLLCGTYVTKILIEYREVFAVIIPELIPCFDFDQKNKHHIYNVYDHIAYAVGFSIPDPEVRLALFLHDIGKPSCATVDERGVGHFYGHGDAGAEISETILKRMRLSNEMFDMVYTLVKFHDYPISPDKRTVKRRLCKFGEKTLRKLMNVKVGDSLAHNPEYGKPTDEIAEINEILTGIIIDNECFTTKDMKINGTDLINMGYKRGPAVGRTLNEILSLIIDEKLENNRDVLLEYAAGKVK